VAVRFRGLELAVATLAFGLVLERLAFRNIAKALSQTSFSSSFVPFGRPAIGGVRFGGDRSFYVFVLVVAVVLFGVVVRLGRGATGRTLRAIREREIAAEVLGVPVIAYRTGAFVLSMVVAATAGALFAAFKSGITPDSFNLDLSFTILAAAVIGGIGSPAGAVIAGALAAVLPELGRSGPLAALLSGEKLFLVFGVGMVVALWRYPRGLAGVLKRARRDAPAVDASFPIDVTPGGRRTYASALDRLAAPTVLRVDDVQVHFGGVFALDGASLVVPRGEICAVIGPNGAGKSTLFNVVTGLVRPAHGRVFLDGRDVTEMPAHRRAALGLGRTFQSVEVFRTLTVIENVMVAAHLGRSAGAITETLALPAARRSEERTRERAHDILRRIGLEASAHAKPGDLTLGALRLLEIGMTLAHDPVLLLLDEPTAGLDAGESERLCALVASLRETAGLTVMLVEHDMSVVGSLADHVYALDFGRIIASGSADEVRRDPIVVEKYLGAAHARKSARASKSARAGERRLTGARR
jgi:ABC-type branched-subunit amino acid transport system ATPase component/branched-subunit amino acid ABC-type transport system permease component